MHVYVYAYVRARASDADEGGRRTRHVCAPARLTPTKEAVGRAMYMRVYVYVYVYMRV